MFRGICQTETLAISPGEYYSPSEAMRPLPQEKRDSGFARGCSASTVHPLATPPHWREEFTRRAGNHVPHVGVACYNRPRPRELGYTGLEGQREDVLESSAYCNPYLHQVAST